MTTFKKTIKKVNKIGDKFSERLDREWRELLNIHRSTWNILVVKGIFVLTSQLGFRKKYMINLKKLNNEVK